MTRGTPIAAAVMATFAFACDAASPGADSADVGGQRTVAGPTGDSSNGGNPSSMGGISGAIDTVGAAGEGGASGAGEGGTGGAGEGEGSAGEGSAGEGSAGEGSAGEGSAGEGSAGEGTGGRSSVDVADVDCYQDGDGVTTLAFVNRCASELTFRGSDIDDGQLASGTFACRDIGDDASPLSAKRYWGFVGDDPGAEHHTLAEFTFNTDFNDFDWYNISHVDAHNLPMQIVPASRPNCETLTCAQDFLPGCPEQGKLANDQGDVVACVSPERNDGESPVALYFEACDDAYAWSGDDQNGDDPSPVRACAGEDWEIVFCPEAE